MFQKKDGLSVGEAVYASLRHDIVFGLLTPSSKLKLDALKVAYRASVTTIREVLNRLISEGFVVAEEQRGYFVAPASKSELREVADARILLEGYALELSIRAGNIEWEAQVIAAHHKLSRMEQRIAAGDLSALEQRTVYDGQFHTALIQSCHSRELLNIHDKIFDRHVRYLVLNHSHRGAETAGEHLALRDAALERNINSARSILRDHIEQGVEYTLANFQKV